MKNAFEILQDATAHTCLELAGNPNDFRIAAAFHRGIAFGMLSQSMDAKELGRFLKAMQAKKRRA